MRELKDAPEVIKAGEQAPGPVLKVRATQVGYYEHCRRREGDVFYLIPRYVTKYNVVDEVVDGKKTGRTVNAGKPVLDKNSQPVLEVHSAEQQLSKRWMEVVPDDEPELTTGAQAALDRTTAELLSAKSPGRKPRR